jgi:hypothetical protein
VCAGIEIAVEFLFVILIFLSLVARLIRTSGGNIKQNKMEAKNMADGCYDLDGRCVNCGRYHPCNCETGNRSMIVLAIVADDTIPKRGGVVCDICGRQVLVAKICSFSVVENHRIVDEVKEGNVCEDCCRVRGW